MNKRSFFSNFALGISAAVFTPHVIIPTWKDTLKYSRVSSETSLFIAAREEFRYIVKQILMPQTDLIIQSYTIKRFDKFGDRCFFSDNDSRLSLKPM